MVEKLDVPERDAQIKAQYWEYRRGGDLRKASKKQFTNLFGSSLGPPLWDAVFEDTVAEWRSSLLGKLSLWTMNGMPVLAAILFFEAFMKSGNEPARSGPLPIEVLLWVSGLVRLVCLWQEIEHKVHVRGLEMHAIISYVLCLLGLPCMCFRLVFASI
jgi:hypothetical protein